MNKSYSGFFLAFFLILIFDTFRYIFILYKYKQEEESTQIFIQYEIETSWTIILKWIIFIFLSLNMNVRLKTIILSVLFIYLNILFRWLDGWYPLHSFLFMLLFDVYAVLLGYKTITKKTA